VGGGRGVGGGRRVRLVLLVAVAVGGLGVVGYLSLLVGQADSRAGAARTPEAPAFRLAELGRAGQKVSLAGFAGRPVIVNVFASWCGPCQRETPLLARFYAAHHGRVLVVGIDANDQEGPALAMVRADRVGYPVGFDPFPAAVSDAYGPADYPQTFFLNARHQIVRHVYGPVTVGELAAWAAQVR
jgi:thiol-disulfide isomerase/thioredoxin